MAEAKSSDSAASAAAQTPKGQKRVCVTGASGLVGRGIQLVVQQAGPHEGTEWIFLSSKDGDLRDAAATRAIFEKHRPTHVIHLAAFVGGLFKNMQFGVEFFRDNMLMTLNVLECCKDFNVEKCISCLSTCIFPDDTTYPIDESMVHDGPPHFSNEGYAYSKRMIDVLNRCYSKEYGCKFTSVIPTNIYGPYDNFNIDDGHVIPGLIHKLYLAKQSGSDFTIWGTGKPLRQFIYSEDLARLFVWALDNYDSSEPIIFSVDPEAEVSIAQVARICADSIGFTGKIVQDTTKADGQFKKTANNAKLRGLLPNFQFTSIEDGILKTVNWFVENYETARK